jgi:hypothetical protein
MAACSYNAAADLNDVLYQRVNYGGVADPMRLPRRRPAVRYSAAVALIGSSGVTSMKPPDCRFHSAA